MKKDLVDQIFAQKRPVLDVRSPCEFAHAHIPGAVNLPLFSDEERKIVGIVYKKLGSRPAIEKGLELVQFSRIVQEIRHLDLSSSIYVYCARGGMRSSSMGWLLELLGYEVTLIQGGYKSFRRWALGQFAKPYSLVVIGGETGSGKTKLLKKLEESGEAVVDLEQLAQHRGSVFGSLAVQPSQEQFENGLAVELLKKRDKSIWVEDESQRIGSATVPKMFFDQMRQSRLIVLQVPLEKRIQACLEEYLPLGYENLRFAITRLKKRLGGMETKRALDAIDRKNDRECCETLLRYYDKKYRYSISMRDPKTICCLPIEQASLSTLKEISYS